MYHVIIKQERRKAPRELALPINNDLVSVAGTDDNGMPILNITSRPAQLHTMGTKIEDTSNLDYAAEWDGSSPYINVLFGDRTTLRMKYMGWPDKTKEEYDAEMASNPPAVVV